MIIDVEFQALIPALSSEEHALLEQSLLNEGCRDALVVWRDTLIDGHNRYALCQKHGIEYKTVERDFQDRNEALTWIIQNQLGRRNLPLPVRIMLVRKGEELERENAHNRKLSGLKHQDIVPQNSAERGAKGETRQKLAAQAGTSHDTYTKSVYVLEEAPEAVKEAWRNEELSTNAAYKLTKAIEAVSPEIQAAVLQHGVTDPQLVTLLEKKKDTDTAKTFIATGVLQPGEEEEAKPASDVSAWDLQGELRKSEKEHRKTALEFKLKSQFESIRHAPEGVYSVIYADPAWQYDNSGLHGAAERHYPTMPTTDICLLLKQLELEVSENAVLFLWGTNPLLTDALCVIEAWGFQYKTNFVWVKDKATTGLGFYTHGQHELLFVATRGSFLPNFKPSSVIAEKKGAHSVKPASTYSMIETMYPDQRYIELFARENQERKGWAFWGLEANV